LIRTVRLLLAESRLAGLHHKLACISSVLSALPPVASGSQGSMQDAALGRLPAEILPIIHSRLLQADPSLRSCLALEATCKHLRSTLHSIARFAQVSVKAGQLGDSFSGWIAANGGRTDNLLLRNVGLRHSTPKLCDLAGVSQARAVAVSAAVIDTLEPLRGLRNLAAVVYEGAAVDAHHVDSVSLEPLAGLPALEEVNLNRITAATSSFASLRSMAALTTLNTRNYEAPQLDDLSSLSKLRQLELAGFGNVTSLAPLSCLTSVTRMALVLFSSLESLLPLHTLTRLQSLALALSTGSIGLEPLRHLTSMTALQLSGSKAANAMTDYDLRPLSQLSRTLQHLTLNECVLQNLQSIGSLGATLVQLSLVGCEQQPPGLQLASLLPQLPRLVLLIISDATAADVDAIGQHLKWLHMLHLKRDDDVTSLAALAPLTRLCSITLKSCSHISSIDPLTALTRLERLHLRSCPQLTSLSPVTALQSLRRLRLEGCPQLVTSLPTSLRPLLVAAGPHV
jgi:hypothetical protein